MNARVLLGSVSFALVVGSAACGSGRKSASPTPTPSPTPGPPLVFTVPAFPVPATSAANECFFVTTSSGGPGVVRFSFTPASTPAGANLATHIWVFTSPNGEPDGQAGCDSLDPAWTLRWATGEGAGAFQFPSGVASPVGATETWVIRMHYVNPSASAATDSTAVRADFDAPGSSFSPAGVFLTGTTSISLPANSTNQQQSGTCTLPASTSAKIFAFAPEMNQYAVHVSVDATIGAAMSTPVDEAWDIASEVPIVLGSAAELSVAAGDQLKTTCTFDNTTSSTIHFGTGYGDEECFDFVYYAPAVSGSQYCGIP